MPRANANSSPIETAVSRDARKRSWVCCRKAEKCRLKYKFLDSVVVFRNRGCATTVTLATSIFTALARGYEASAVGSVNSSLLVLIERHAQDRQPFFPRRNAVALARVIAAQRAALVPLSVNKLTFL
jgi:hypothetical protein